ncbi:DUF294 nucleotidyltransferase-like domain-containing protein [Effusibacillus lacus]|uniref:Nucleotidyltransferase n=1 Tax=Effusibacillus lacus TaxID=1348429 RepID=A0A292YI09_9BACL|nr:DUF294 nucleotidyltransferase-like domain-containing protein [Effusibacillus lacus]TCS73620.1 CBS domain-containing protein [Effusibacillus lacus]GAX89488.1 hypothetical protein [Effusibacillus lacus]
MEKAREILSDLDLFAGLNRDELELLEREARICSFQEHDKLAGADRPLEAVYVVLKGHVRVAICNDKEEEITLHYHGPGDMFGLAGLFAVSPMPFHFIAAESGEALLLPLRTVKQLLYKYPANLWAASRALAERLYQVYREFSNESSYGAKGVDQYPIRLKVGDIMSGDVATCRSETTAAEAAGIMGKRNIGSLVVLDGNGELVGIVTDKDLVTRIMATGLDPCVTTVGSLFTAGPITISHEAFYYEALLLMMNHRVSHLPVVDRTGLVGILTMKDLLDAKSHHALALTERIEHSDQIGDLCSLADRVEQLVDRMQSEGIRPSEICRIMADYDDRITRKIIRLVEKELAEEGFGPPPVPYCWVTMGSGGRKEQPRRTDQDNALIYRDPAADQKEAAERYFARLAEKTNDALHRFGFPYCPGGVMAKNPVWRKTISGWREEVADWIREPDGQGVRNLTIFLDFRPVYGTFELAHELRIRILYLTQNVPMFLHQLVLDDVQSPVHLGWFDRGEIEIKTRLSVHFINALRILSLKHGLPQVNSLERLRALTEHGVFTPEESSVYEEAYEELMRYRVGGIRKIDIGSLKKQERARLKRVFHITKDLQNLLIHSFRAEGLAL